MSKHEKQLKEATKNRSSSSNSNTNHRCRAVLVAISAALFIYILGLCIFFVVASNQPPNIAVTDPETSNNDNKPASAFWAITNMQDMTAAICDSATTPVASARIIDTNGEHDGDNNYVPTRTLLDSRDSNEYTVSKLADGKCWMTENLNYHITTSNIASDGKGGSYIWDVNSENITKVSDSESYTSFNDSYDAPVSFYSTYGDNEKYGTYYNWYAALAATADTVLDTTSYDNGGSVCPVGWRLPYGGSMNPDSNGRRANLCPSKNGCTSENDNHGDSPGGFYYLLNTTYGIDKTSVIIDTPFIFQYSGSVWAEVSYSGILADKAGYSYGGDYGILWSSTSSTGDSAYTLYYSDNSTAMKDEIEYEAHIKNIGYPVRCVSI